MTDTFGDWALMLALAGCGAGLLAAVLALDRKSTPLLRVSSFLVHAVTLLLTLACWRLMAAIFDNDFSLAYVADFSERALPKGFKFAAFWAGQQGSLLLWAWMVAVCGSLAVRFSRRDGGKPQAVVILVQLVAAGFFVALLLWGANPFKLLLEVPADGQGLNPLLQDLAMILHPPLLFAGYAGFTVPLALTAAALVAGRLDGAWLVRLRQWTLLSWVFLTAGIVLGAQWAYVELGWGGYWAWDPVENASLLPWFTSTALIHTLILHRTRDRMKRWNIFLVGASFLLCIFATYLTRSGIISSVHAFPKSALGWFFLVFLIAGSVFWLCLFVWRRGLLGSPPREGRTLSRENAAQVGAILLTLMMLAVIVGTLFPILSQPFAPHPITLGPPFYNHLVAPIAMVMAAVMALAPLLPYAQGRLPRTRLVIALVPAGAAAGAVIVFTGSFWLAGGAAIAALAVGIFLLELLGRIVSRGSTTPAGFRRLAACAAHAGLALVVMGASASDLLVKADLRLAKGQAATIGRYTLRFDGLREVHGVNFMAGEAQLQLTKPGTTAMIPLRPQRRFYDKSPKEPNSEVAIHTTLREDVYVSLLGWKDEGQSVTIHAMVHPLVVWIWIGGAITFVAAILSLIVRPAANVQLTVPPAVPLPDP